MALMRVMYSSRSGKCSEKAARSQLLYLGRNQAMSWPWHVQAHGRCEDDTTKVHGALSATTVTSAAPD